jgi:hypothetical protein
MTASKKTFVCFANSWKPNGTCVAGRILRPDGTCGKWIRPTGADPSHSVSRVERAYETHDDPKVLDVIEILVQGHEPEHHQVENYRLAPGTWKKVGHITWSEALAAAETPPQLWPIGRDSGSGANDEVALSVAHQQERSLFLIHVHDLRLVSFTSTFDGKTKKRARFTYAGASYDLAMTDRVVAIPQNTEVKVPESLLCVSLPGPVPGRELVYKLVAGVIIPV